MRRLLFVLLLIVLPLSLLAAQESEEAIPEAGVSETSEEADWFFDKPIANIRFAGLSHVNPRDLDGIIKQFTGKQFTENLFLDLQSKLYALNFFESFTDIKAEAADASKTSVILVFYVVERPIVKNIVIEGNKNIRRADILEVILLKQDDIVNKVKITSDADAVKSLYMEKGYPNVKVEGTTRDNGDNTIDVVFSVSEGSQTRVKTILFSGNSFASEGTLKGLLETKEQGFLSSGIFQEIKLQEDIQKIQMYYWEKGYIDAKVVNVTRDIDPESTEGKNLLLLTIYITEGEQYTYGGMTFEGNTIISTEALNSMLRLAPGSVLNKTRLEQDYAKVTDLYYNDGYIYNVITRQEIRNEAEKTISYHVVIVEKSRAHIENIILKGNSKTKDSVILREIPIIEGDVFSKDKVLQGIQNLYNTQFFSNIIPETPYGSAEGLMDLVINVEEGRTTEVNFGLTFSGGLGDVPVSGFVKWVDKNFLGRGQEFSLGTEVSSTTQSLTVGFTENWLAGKRWSAGVNLSFSHSLLSGQYQDFLAPFNVGVPDPYDGHYVWASSGENATGYTQDDIDDGTVVTDYKYAVDNDESIADGYLMKYDSWEFAISLSTGYSIHTPYGRLGFGGGIKPSLDMIDYDPTKYRAYDEDVRNGLGEWKYNNRLWFSVSWDKRDYIYSPSKGYYFTEILTYTGGLLFGQTNYIKSVTRAEFYQKVFEIPMSDEWDLKMIFASRSALSLIFPQFYYDSAAGKWVVGKAATTSDLLYTDGMMVARGWYPRKTDGQAMWDTMLELRVPIVEQYIWFDLFGSGTGFWGSSDTVMNPFLSLKGMTINDYLFTLGGGLRFTIPGLPIGMYLVKRFKFEDNVFKWQEGVMFKDSDRENSGLDFVIALTMYM